MDGVEMFRNLPDESCTIVSPASGPSGYITRIVDNLQRPGTIYESGLPVRISIGDTDGIRLTPG